MVIYHSYYCYIYTLLPSVTSEQHSTKTCAEVADLTLRGKGRQVNFFHYCWPFSCQCFCCVEISQLICIANWVTGCCVGWPLTWKRLSIDPY